LLPQREISKLANRLYLEAIDEVGKKSARRIPEDVIERDYVLAWLLTQIPTNTLLCEALTFKGGTALRRMHFGEYRFSEDLDFTGNPRGGRVGSKVLSPRPRFSEPCETPQRYRASHIGNYCLRPWHCGSNGKAAICRRCLASKTLR
jgi:hypothetical protein